MAARAKEGLTPLHVAAAGGYGDAVRMLMEQGAAADVRDDNGRTPLELAAHLGHEGVVAVLSLAQGSARLINRHSV